MPAICSICLQVRPHLKFRTGRLSICGFCVSTLNRSSITPRQAKGQWLATFREAVIRNKPDAAGWIDRWLETSHEWIIADRLASPPHVRRSPELKVLRAHRGGLLTIDRTYLDKPANWWFKSRRVRHWHNDTCALCSRQETDDSKLHTHHIIFRSRGGTNGYRNLIPLCVRHHQAQHPGLQISNFGGEPRGLVQDNTLDLELPDDGDFPLPALPPGFSEAAYIEARPMFLAGLDACKRDGKTMREFFVMLYQMFGENLRDYALRFAADERLRRVLRRI